MTVRVDARWKGNHGIGRYAREVISRLELPWEAIPLAGNPGSPRDLLSIRFARPMDMVYSPGYNAGLGKVRQLVTVHDLIHLTEPLIRYHSYYEHVLRPVIRRARCVLTVSETSRELIGAWVRDDRVRIINAGNGISAAFTPDGKKVESLGEFFLFVGNFKRHKNPAVIFEAIAGMPDSRLVVVGPSVRDTNDFAEAYGISRQVTAMHGVPDESLAELYRGARATVLPSTLEGFGLPAAESLACGTPVVYWSGCQSVAEIVGDRGSAVDAAHTPEAWREAMRHTDQHLARRTSIQIGARYSWPSVAKCVSTAIREFEDAR